MKLALALAASIAAACTAAPRPVTPDRPTAHVHARVDPATADSPDEHARSTAAPNRRRIVVSDTDIDILDPISFVANTSELAPASTPILDAVAHTLHGNPSITLLEVRGHSDWSEPDPRHRAELSIRRAEAVVAALVDRGIAPARLSAYGASDDELASRTDSSKNRGVDLDDPRPRLAGRTAKQPVDGRLCGGSRWLERRGLGLVVVPTDVQCRFDVVCRENAQPCGPPWPSLGR